MGAADLHTMDDPLNLDGHFMNEALRQAWRAYDVGEVPVGAVVVRAGKIIGRAFNQVELLKDATAHAEMLALTQAQSAVGDWRLTDCTLYVTKEPCPMCAGALVHCRCARVVFGALDTKGGAAGGVINLLQFPTLNHRCEITSGVRGEECASLLRHFFGEQRTRKRELRESRTVRAQDSDASGGVEPGIPGADGSPQHLLGSTDRDQ